jgi:hypothetical protein
MTNLWIATLRIYYYTTIYLQVMTLYQRDCVTMCIKITSQFPEESRRKVTLQYLNIDICRCAASCLGYSRRVFSEYYQITSERVSCCAFWLNSIRIRVSFPSSQLPLVNCVSSSVRTLHITLYLDVALHDLYVQIAVLCGYIKYITMVIIYVTRDQKQLVGQLRIFLINARMT